MEEQDGAIKYQMGELVARNEELTVAIQSEKDTLEREKKLAAELAANATAPPSMDGFKKQVDDFKATLAGVGANEVRAGETFGT
eukprot:9497377-Pyramimonas_sp.AAC.1